MKIIFKTTIVILFFSLFFSCGDDSAKEENPPVENGDCMEFVAMNNDIGKVIYLDFIDSNNGWAIGKKNDYSHNLLNTTDGGTTWSVIKDDFQLDYDNGYVSGEALQFVTATNGFKVDDSSDEGFLNLQYTTDKGATWTKYANPFLDVINGGYDNNYSIGETFASNGTQTLLISEGSTSTAGWTYKTLIIIDNTTMDIVSSENVRYNSLHYSVVVETHAGIGYHYSSNGTITAVVTETSNNTGDLKMAQSIDNGETWTFTSGVLDGEHFISSNWVNDEVGYVAVGFYSGTKSLYKTTDGGTTWNLINNDPPKFQMIRFADSENGIGVTDFDFFYTTDAGVSWTEIEVCKNSDGQYNMGYDEVVAYPSVNYGWVAGSKYNEDYANNPGSTKGIFKFILE